MDIPMAMEAPCYVQVQIGGRLTTGADLPPLDEVGTATLWRARDAAGTEWIYCRFVTATGVRCWRVPPVTVTYHGPTLDPARRLISCALGSVWWEAVADCAPPP